MDQRAETARGVVEVSGPEARALLQRLVTNDVEALTPGDARYAALLTPQGKIIVDFIMVSAPTPDEPERFFLDCPAALAADLAKRLTLYRLRAKVTIRDRSADLVAVALQDAPSPVDTGLIVYSDPRSAALGLRAIGSHEAVASLPGTAPETDARRIAAGVPEGGIDFAYGDAFPHDANLDRLQGVDFRKGCYVGQEVVSRMQHRGTARKRIVAVTFDGNPPPPGTEIRAGDLPVGTMGSSAGQRGLALVRTDRIAEAIGPLIAQGVELRAQL